MIIEYALLVMKDLKIPEIIDSAVFLIEDYKFFIGAGLLFLVFFIVAKKW